MTADLILFFNEKIFEKFEELAEEEKLTLEDFLTKVIIEYMYAKYLIDLQNL